jgi:hypothetical protein
MLRDREKLRKVMILISVIIVLSMLLLAIAPTLVSQPVTTPTNVQKSPPAR